MTVKRPTSSNPDQLCLGVIVGAQGVRGEVRIKAFTADALDIGSYGALTNAPKTQTFDVTVLRLAKGVVIAKIKGITDRNGAEALKGTELFMDRSQLPETDDEETFYHADLIGLDVFDDADVLLGRVTAVFDHGAGDVLDIRMAADGRLISLPFTKAVVPVVDIAAGRVVINMPEGMLSDDKEAKKAETKGQQELAAGEKQ